MKINFQSASLYHACFDPAALFDGCDRRVDQLPHLMIMGKSNVGKSSLFNTLTRTPLAKVSATPGKTRALFFYLIDNQLLAVDMPGFGFAQGASLERTLWSKLLQEYLNKEVANRKILYLHDVRRDWTVEEHELFRWFSDKKIPVGIVQTKCDKLTSTQLRQLQNKNPLPNADASFFYSTRMEKLCDDFKTKLTTWLAN